MSMKKKAIMAASYVMVAALAIGGTVAYLTDTDEDINVMTLGNVQIEQIEQEWNADKTELVDFTQNKQLLPYVPAEGKTGTSWAKDENAGTAYRRFDMKNVIDKYVSVKNTGMSDAYVRTVFAFEMGKYDKIEDFQYKVIGYSYNKVNGDSFNGDWNWSDNKQVVKIGDENYMLVTATYKEALAPNATTMPSLMQIYMSKDADNDAVQKVDGNNNGKYDVLVFSQAVQAEGFDSPEAALDEAFGEITATAHPWSGIEVDAPVVYTSGEHTISGDITLTDADKATDCVTADGEGVVVNILDGTYFDNNENADDQSCVVWAKNGATVNIYGGTFKANAIEAGSHSDMIYAGANGGIVNIYGGTFEAVTADDWLLNEKDKQGTMTVYGGTFKNFDPSKVDTEPTNPTNFVADGYKVVATQDGEDTWYTVVKE